MSQTNMLAFTDACYDQNSLDELVEALENPTSSATDRAYWNITQKQWRQAIANALRQRVTDLLDEAIELRAQLRKYET